ncbi:hypothetical protein MAH1_37080 [Sessilibacter sp. MAH1]
MNPIEQNKGFICQYLVSYWIAPKITIVLVMCGFFSVWLKLFPLPLYLTYIILFSVFGNSLVIAYQAVNKFPNGALSVLLVSGISWFSVWVWLVQTI